MLAGAAWHWPAKCLVTPSIADWLLSDRASPSIGWSVLPSVRRYVPRKKINITFFEENKQSQCKWWCVSMTLHLYEGHPFISFFYRKYVSVCPFVSSSVCLYRFLFEQWKMLFSIFPWLWSPKMRDTQQQQQIQQQQRQRQQQQQPYQA